jgi:hypothetical protein
MPFTLAHPAVVLPLHARWRAGFWGLVAGSLGPDIPYFLPSRIGEALPKTHTVLGAATVAAPLALLLLVVVVAGRRVLVAPLWGAFRSSVEATLGGILRQPSAWLHLIPAAIIGAEIHLLWDSFTHKEGWMVLHLPALVHDVSPVAGHPLKLFRALQYVSSVLGMVAILAWCRARLTRDTGGPAGAAGPAGWRPWALGSLAVIALTAAGGAVLTPSPHTVQYVAATTAVGTFSVLYVLLGTFATAWRREPPCDPWSGGAPRGGHPPG